MRYVNVLLGIFFEQLYGYILQKLPEKNEKNLYIIIEEASSLFVPVLPVAIANTRKHRVGNLLCVQSQDQLTTFYKQDAKNVVANCITKIFMAGQTSIDLLKELEIYSGKTTYTDDKGRERIQSLISVDEIRLLPKNRTLILSGNNPIIKGHTSPFFLSWKYKRRSLIPPIPIIGDIPDGPIPLLGEE
jgi:type IV secretory pathway TraG/TraD family ATPase VirD4